MPAKTHDHERAERYENAARELQKYIVRAEDGTFILNVPSAKSIGVDPVAFADLKRSLKETNRKIRRGELDRNLIELAR